MSFMTPSMIKKAIASPLRIHPPQTALTGAELRPEQYPTKEIAYLAITALRRHESPPTAPVDETWMVCSKEP